jgi:hypothetical protein
MRQTIIIFLLLMCIACAGPPQRPSPDTLTSDIKEGRWNLLSTPQKWFWLHQSNLDGKQAFHDALKEEFGWACWAEKKGLALDPTVRLRLDEAAHRILFEEAVRQSTLKACVAEADIQDYYRLHEPDFSLPEEVEAAQILIATRKGNETRSIPVGETSGEKQTAQLVKELQEKLAAGEDFFGLARLYSEDKSAAAGGKLGWFGRRVMVKSFEEAAFSTPVGRVSAPVKTEYGTHLIYVMGRRGGKPLPLAEVRRDIEDALLTRNKDKVEEMKRKIFQEVKSDCFHP